MARSVVVLLLALLAWTGSAIAQTPPRSTATLPTLTTAREVHSLTQDEARRAYPVHLRVIVTYYDPYIDSRRGAMFVNDSSGSVFVAMPSQSALPIRAGTLVDIVGVSAPGDYAPIVEQPVVKVRGQSQVPRNAPRVTLPQLLSGSEDGQWIEIEGVVHAVRATDKNAILDIATAGGPVSATTMREAAADYIHLVDSRIRLHANAAPLFNGHLQMVGVHLYFPDLRQVQVIQPAPIDPFSIPVKPIDNLLQFTPREDLPHRARVEGTVTLQWPGRMLCIQQFSDGLCIQTEQTSLVSAGDKVDVVGFPAISDFKPTLEHAIFRIAGNGVLSPPAQVTAAQAISGDYDSALVRIDGELIGVDRTASDPTLLLRIGSLVLPSILPKGPSGPDISALKEGSQLRITGICSVQVDAQTTLSREGGVRLKSVHLFLRSLDDVEVLKTPSWWTPAHTLELLGIVAALALAAVFWVLILRHRVEEQTQVIRRNEDRLRHVSQHDALTNLPNRILLTDRLNMALERCRRFQAGLGLLMVDLDRFKEVNDSLGHQAGDQLLCEVATRIRTSVRKTDTVARIGGDEFVVLLPDLQSPAEAETIAGKIVVSVSAPIHLGQAEAPISVSVGVCTYPLGGSDSAALLENVDIAMYQAKAKGRNGFQVYTPDMAQASQNKLELEFAMKRAIGLREFQLCFQPIFSVETGKPMGLEASLFWKDRHLGVVPPAQFLPLAEETGLSVPLGEWTLSEACLQVAQLERQLGRRLLLVLPVASRQLQSPGLVKAIESALAASGRPANLLQISLSENLLLQASLRASLTLKKIRGLGVLLAIDDFGSGSSRLASVGRFGVDHLRIGSSFVLDCVADPKSAAVTRAIIAMARGLGLETVADGVETAAQLQFLRDAQCTFAQGSYFSPPATQAELATTLQAHGARVG
jgi:diguanylate cyclase (GGDEF)-like protein